MIGTVTHGDCLEWLAGLPADSVDACVTDPPYGLGKPPPIDRVLRAWLAGEAVEVTGGGFMGRAWDAFVPGPRYWRAVWRVLKPGAHAVVFAGQRTVDVMGVALRLAGFEMRDLGGWAYFSGFPKSMAVGRAIDREMGAVRPVVGTRLSAGGRSGTPVSVGGHLAAFGRRIVETSAASPTSAVWDGWGTALKPAIESWLLVRKPISEGSIARNVLKWGVGGLNIDGCRFAAGDRGWVGPDSEMPTEADAYTPNHLNGVYGAGMGGGAWQPAAGRWPANLYHCPKASTAEREAGCDGLPLRTAGELTSRAEGSAGLTPRAGAGRSSDGRRNTHPTVKPVGLARWLVRLVTPPDGVVIDPFTGSGTTGIAAGLEGVGFAGAELNDTDAEPFVRIARARMAWWAEHGDRAVEVWQAGRRAEAERVARVEAGQLELWG